MLLLFSIITPWFYSIAYGYSRADWDGFCDHFRNVLWEDIFYLSASAAASEFCEWVRAEIDAHIPHRKYQVKSQSFPWLLIAFPAATVHRNQASTRWKRVLEAAKLVYATKTKESITFQKLGVLGIWRIANSVLNICKSAILSLFNDQEWLSSVSDKAKLFAKNFLKNSNLDDSSISLPVFSSRTNLKQQKKNLTSKIVKKIITNCDSSKILIAFQ